MRRSIRCCKCRAASSPNQPISRNSIPSLAMPISFGRASTMRRSRLQCPTASASAAPMQRSYSSASMHETGRLMAGKRGLIMGVANDHSIAWGIARKLAQEGAELAFTFQGDAQAKRVKPLAESVTSKQVLPCDVGNDAELDAVFGGLQSDWG